MEVQRFRRDGRLCVHLDSSCESEDAVAELVYQILMTGGYLLQERDGKLKGSQWKPHTVKDKE